MKIKEILDIAIKEGINADPRANEEIESLLKSRKEEYDSLSKKEQEIYDNYRLKSPYDDSRIISGNPETDVNQAWVGIDIDTAELLLIKELSKDNGKNPVAIAHHPLGRAYSNFYEVMDMQADILEKIGVTSSVAETLTRKRKAEVSRKVAPGNHMRVQNAADLINLPVMNIHTPADNHVKEYLDKKIGETKPEKVKDLLDLLLSIEEYRVSAVNGTPPKILTGDKRNKCGKVFVDMTGGTEGESELIKSIATGGVSTIIAMHMSEKHFKAAKESNINVIIAGHISSDNVGMNLLLDKIVKNNKELEIVAFSGFVRVERNGK